MALCRIVVDRGLGQADVFSPFEAKDIVKTMPSRTWDKERRCWTIPAIFVDDLRAALEAAGFKAVVTETGRQRQQREQPPPRPGRTAGTWADAMFRELGPDLGDRAYKQLVRVLHPDVGGSTTHMQVLNAARDKHRRAS